MKKCNVIVMVMILVLGLFGCGQNDTDACEEVVQNFEQAINSVDVGLLEETYIPCFFEELEDCFSSRAEMREELADEMEDRQVRIEFLGAIELPLEEGYEELYDDVLEAHKKEIDKIYIVRVMYQEDTFAYEDTQEIPVVKIGKNWYWADMYF